MKQNEPKKETKRKPQSYYHSDIREPKGKLVQLQESMRTYQMSDGNYTTIIGGESGLYIDEDQSISKTDTTLIPTEGEFNESIAEGNAIRYSNVFPGVDYQYTMTGNSLKEDIVLLKPVDKHTFSYRHDLERTAGS